MSEFKQDLSVPEHKKENRINHMEYLEDMEVRRH